MAAPIGRMRERLTIQRCDPRTLSVSSLVRSSTTATATTAVPHGYLVGDYVTFAGSLIPGWNAKFKLLTVPTPNTFTFTCSASLTTPATGTITVVYTSNAQGGRVGHWRTLDTVPAEMIPLRTGERLQFTAVQSDVAYRFRIRSRSDVTGAMRLVWTPSAPAGAARKTLVLTGNPLPDGDGRVYQFLEAAEAPAA